MLKKALLMAAAFTAGVLLAPRSGKETIAEMDKKAREVSEKVKEKMKRKK